VLASNPNDRPRPDWETAPICVLHPPFPNYGFPRMPARGDHKTTTGKFKSPFRYWPPAELKHLHARVRYRDREAYCFQDGSFGQWSRCSLETGAGREAVFVQAVTARPALQVRGRKRTVKAGFRCIAKYIGSRRCRKGRDRTRQVCHGDAVAPHWQAVAGDQGQGDKYQEPFHRVKLLICWYISSEALTTLELASYARCATIRLMNSSTTLTLDCS